GPLAPLSGFWATSGPAVARTTAARTPAIRMIGLMQAGESMVLRVSTSNSATSNSQATSNSKNQVWAFHIARCLVSGAIPAGDRSGSALRLRHVEKRALHLEVRDPRGDPTSSPHAAAPAAGAFYP